MMVDQVDRILGKIRDRRMSLNPVTSEADVIAFEQKHGIQLPDEYRTFLLRVGNGGLGPPFYRLQPLGEVPSGMTPRENAEWSQLALVREAFPFTRYWVWEEGELSTEGTEDDVHKGSLRIGDDGCGMYWHLIITGPDRGMVWQITGEGIQPIAPKRSFLQWYEDWLDGKDSFYGFTECT